MKVVCWLTVKLGQEPSIPGKVILGNARTKLIFFFFFNFCSIPLCPLFAAGPKYYFAEKTSRVATVIHERGILRSCENTTLDTCQDQRLNVMGFVCNQQHSLKLVLTSRLSYPEKFSSSCSLPLWLVCSTAPGGRTFSPPVVHRDEPYVHSQEYWTETLLYSGD